MMTPTEKVQWLILAKVAEFNETDPPAYPCENIDDLWDSPYEDNWDDLDDATEEIRGGGQDTNLPCEHSRHYESKSKGMQMPDGSWVGWTYWYGGGKHGEPSAIDWISEAYDLDCIEEEKLVVVRTFTKRATAP